MEHLDTAIVLIPLLAVIAPLAARAIGPRLRVPVVVFELALGIVVGPSAFVDVLSEFGLAMLFFVAGTEIEFAALRERSGRRAIGGWLISIALGVAVGLLVAPGLGAVVIGIALASTALGTLLPILRDAGELRTPFGRAVGALGAVGEFGPLVAISHDREAVESKVEAIAFGFLVPLFFIYTGVTFDLASLLDDPRLLAMVPLALLVLLAVRGLPSALAAPQGSDRKTTAAVVLLGATGLPIIVAVTAIGVDEGLISSGLASVLVGAGMLSVLLFPLIGMALRGDRVPSTTVRVDDEV